MNGIIITKPHNPPWDEVSLMVDSCKDKLVEQLHLRRTFSDDDGYGSTAIESKHGCTSLEGYVRSLLEVMCKDYFLTTDADGHPLALIAGHLQDDDTFDVRVSLHIRDANGSTAYVYDDDFQSEDLIAQYNQLGCARYRCYAFLGQAMPAYLEQQGFVDITSPEDNFRTIQGPWGW